MGKKSVITIGFFDGVHRGHRSLIKDVVSLSKNKNLESVIVTFDRVNADKGGMLTTLKEKINLLKETGIDKIAIFEFTKHFSMITPYDFFYEIILKEFQPSVIIIGHDFRFGRNRQGNAILLEKLCKKEMIKLIKKTPVKYYDNSMKKSIVISSSLIRSYLKESKIEVANRLLSKPYEINGLVVKGKGIGKKLGFPTANICVPSEKLIPEGVFYVHTFVNNTVYCGLANFGRRPTLQNKTGYEVHLINFKGNLLGKYLKIFVNEFLREEIKFDTPEQLKKQINEDIKKIFKKYKYLKKGVYNVSQNIN